MPVKSDTSHKTVVCGRQPAGEQLPSSLVAHRVSACGSFCNDEAQKSPQQKDPAGRDGVRQPRTAKSILDRIGWKGLCLIVWRSTPFPLRLISFFYGLAVYRRLLAASKNPFDLRTLHTDKYRSSPAFRLLRPRYHKVRQLLASLGMEERVPPE